MDPSGQRQGDPTPPAAHPDIAFLHPPPAHVSTFAALVSHTDDEIGVASFVNESSCRTLVVAGPRHAEVGRRMHDAVLKAAV